MVTLEQEEAEWRAAIARDLGDFTPSHPCPPEVIDRYADRAPRMLLDHWREHGFGSWLRGGVWLANPEDLAPVLNMVFRGDPEFTSETTWAYGYDAFGQLLCAHPDYPGFTLDLPFSRTVQSSGSWPQIYADNDGAVIQLRGVYAGLTAARRMLADDETDRPLLPQAITAHGRLEYGEVYGFFPALAMGGAQMVDNLQRVRLREHLLFVADLGTVELELFFLDRSDPYSPDNGPRIIRTIGPQRG